MKNRLVFLLTVHQPADTLVQSEGGSNVHRLSSRHWKARGVIVTTRDGAQVSPPDRAANRAKHLSGLFKTAINVEVNAKVTIEHYATQTVVFFCAAASVLSLKVLLCYSDFLFYTLEFRSGK
jgi:hypothetical protein